MTELSQSNVAGVAPGYSEPAQDPGQPIPTARRVRRGGSPIARIVPFVFAVALVAAVAGGLWSAAKAQQGDAPQQLGSYRLREVTTGPAAVAQMSRLHGRGVGVVDGYVGHYEGPSGGAMLYVGETASEKDALDLLGQMEERIGAGNQYFTDLKSLTVEGVRLFTVRSGPQTHYFWQTGKKVIWMGFDRDDPTELAIAVKGLR